MPAPTLEVIEILAQADAADAAARLRASQDRHQPGQLIATGGEKRRLEGGGTEFDARLREFRARDDVSEQIWGRYLSGVSLSLRRSGIVLFQEQQRGDFLAVDLDLWRPKGGAEVPLPTPPKLLATHEFSADAWEPRSRLRRWTRRKHSGGQSINGQGEAGGSRP